MTPIKPPRTRSARRSSAATATTLTSSTNPVLAGNPVTFTASVSSANVVPLGSVTFFRDGVALATVKLQGGQAIYTTAALTRTSTGHTILARYNPTPSFLTSRDSLTQVVGPVGSTLASVTVVSSANPSTAKSAVTFTATVAGAAATPTGWVRFKIGAVLSPFVPLDGTGNAAYTHTFPRIGIDRVTVYYYGDATYAIAQSATLQQVVTSVLPTNLVPTLTFANPTFTLTVQADTAWVCSTRRTMRPSRSAS